MNSSTSYERPRLDIFVKVLNVVGWPVFFRFCGFSACLFSDRSPETFEKSRTDPGLSSDFNQKSETQTHKTTGLALLTKDGNFKLLRSLGIDSKKSIPLAGTTTLFLLGSQPPQIDQEFQHWNRTWTTRAWKRRKARAHAFACLQFKQPEVAYLNV